jgi:hypothetical protein
LASGIAAVDSSAAASPVPLPPVAAVKNDPTIFDDAGNVLSFRESKVHPDFVIQRHRTSAYLPAAQALERLPNPEEKLCPPRSSVAALELSRRSEKQQRGGQVEDLGFVEDSALASREHLRQHGPVSLSRKDRIANARENFYEGASLVRNSATGQKAAPLSPELSSPGGVMPCHASSAIAQQALTQKSQTQALTVPAPIVRPPMRGFAVRV